MEGWYSTRCKLTWKLKGTKYSRMYCQLAVSTHHTSDLESGLLLTPTTREEVQDLHKFKKRMEKYPNGTTMPNLATQVMGLLPTPRTLMPIDAADTEVIGNQSIRKNGKRFGANLETLASRGMLPTPMASDCRVHYPTENWRGTSDLGSVINGINGTRSHLSPHFVMEMMGFPTDWTLLPFLNGEANQSKPVETR
jgi:hypothetical protein